MKNLIHTVRHQVMCGYAWGTCGRQGDREWSHVCGVWIWPGERHAHVCGTCNIN